MKKALVIEGGGMKAAFANGVLTAFEQAGNAPWDAVYGTSAGGALAAWYSAGQAEFAEGTWRFVQDGRFINYRRALAFQGPLLAHDDLLDLVYQDEHPLDTLAVQAAPWPVVVTACDIESGRCVYRDLRDGDVILWLKATGRLPFGAGPPVEIGGHRYVDGGVLDAVPVRRAVEDGADQVTVVLNRPVGPVRSDPRWLVNLAVRRYPALRHGFINHAKLKQSTLAYALHPPDGVTVHVLAPPEATGLGRMSRDLAAIGAAIRLGRAVGASYVEDPEVFQDRGFPVASAAR